jgi:hypothetical protein
MRDYSVCVEANICFLVHWADCSLFDLETLPPPFFGSIDEKYVGKVRAKSNRSRRHHKLFRTGPGSTSSCSTSCRLESRLFCLFFLVRLIVSPLAFSDRASKAMRDDRVCVKANDRVCIKANIYLVQSVDCSLFDLETLPPPLFGYLDEKFKPKVIGVDGIKPFQPGPEVLRLVSVVHSVD